tara:strand:+ start:93 stop:668 length:576 start_codon:yes stop_codon:yes gene_type:complete
MKRLLLIPLVLFLSCEDKQEEETLQLKEVLISVRYFAPYGPYQDTGFNYIDISTQKRNWANSDVTKYRFIPCNDGVDTSNFSCEPYKECFVECFDGEIFGFEGQQHSAQGFYFKSFNVPSGHSVWLTAETEDFSYIPECPYLYTNENCEGDCGNVVVSAIVPGEGQIFDGSTSDDDDIGCSHFITELGWVP